MDIKFTACTPADFKIKTLYEDFYKLNKIDFNAEYQRSEVWRLPKKQLLLDSILRNFDISKIFLRQLCLLTLLFVVLPTDKRLPVLCHHNSYIACHSVLDRE